MLSKTCAQQTLVLALGCFPMSVAAVGDAIPVVDMTADWKYSDISYDSGDFRTVTAGTPSQPIGFGNEASFYIDWNPSPTSLPIQYETNFGQSNKPYLIVPPTSKLGNYVAFSHENVNPYSDNPDSKFVMRYTGSFSADHMEGQRYRFQAEMSGYGDYMKSGSKIEIDLKVNGAVKESVVYRAGTGATGLGWDPVTWDTAQNRSGQSWEIVIRQFGEVGALGWQGGIGNYIPELGDPVPGPGIVVSSILGLGAIRGRRRRD